MQSARVYNEHKLLSRLELYIPGFALRTLIVCMFLSGGYVCAYGPPRYMDICRRNDVPTRLCLDCSFTLFKHHSCMQVGGKTKVGTKLGVWFGHERGKVCVSQVYGLHEVCGQHNPKTLCVCLVNEASVPAVLRW